jgi:HEAT repeat protein
MPLIKKGSGTARPPEPPEIDAASLLGDLRNDDPQTRWTAARALGGKAEAVSALSAALSTEQVSRVREALMTALMRIGDKASILALLPYLRSQDASLRGAAVDALQALPDAIHPFMSALLADSDADVRILATELTRKMPAETATALLTDVLTRDTHPNVCAAAIEVLAETGTRQAIPALQACVARFPGTPFLQFAVSVALARINATES